MSVLKSSGMKRTSWPTGQLSPPSLASLREHWAGSTDDAALAIFLASTNDTLGHAAQVTNDFTDLSKIYKPKPTVNPDVRAVQRVFLDNAKALRILSSAPAPDADAVIAAQQKCSDARASLQCPTRNLCREESNKRDQQIHQILKKKPADLFKTIRSMKSSSSGEI